MNHEPEPEPEKSPVTQADVLARLLEVQTENAQLRDWQRRATVILVEEMMVMEDSDPDEYAEDIAAISALVNG